MSRLNVHLYGKCVGGLEQDSSGLVIFRYNSGWLNDPEAIPLSRSLPLQPEPFHGKQARAFFAGILPDKGPREQIAAILGISANNDYAMLERIGGECAGAVSLLPEGASPPPASKRIVRELDERELEQIIAELPRRPLMAGQEGLRLSLAGAQAKLPVVLRGKIIALPLGDTPSTHIIKPEPDRFPGLVTAEALCMTLAKALGLSVPQVHTRRVGPTPCLLVQRYDRARSADGAITRLHQEDFCQALGMPPERKYQQEGGPLVRDCIGLLRDWSTLAALDLRDFLDGLIFNMFIGNADAHGKNYSLLYHRGSRRLAPFYDLVSTLPWRELAKVPAMKIGKSNSIEQITSAHWQALARENSLGWPMLRERIGQLGARLLEQLQTDKVQGAADDPATAELVTRTIQQQAQRLLRRLTPKTLPS